MSLSIHPDRATTHTSRGFTLIEVLVSLSILALGMLGMAAMQNESLKFNNAALIESQAQFLLADMAERIRANSGNNTYVMTYVDELDAVTVNCATASCNSNQMALWDRTQWRAIVADTLPQGESQILFNTLNRNYVISVRYDWSQLGGEDITNGKRTVTITTRISGLARVMRPSLSQLSRKLLWQTGLSMVELMVSIAIAMTVMSGVVQVLIVSKANFLTERELSGLQENARFALKFLGDELRLAGFTGCTAGTPGVVTSTPVIMNSIFGGVVGGIDSWYLGRPGMRGYEYDGGVVNYPVEFRADVRANTDALAVRRAEDMGLRVNAVVAAAAALPVQTHSVQRGQAMVVASSDCRQISVFQSTGPANSSNNQTTVDHATGGGIVPGNCNASLGGSFYCATASTTTGGTPTAQVHRRGSRVMQLRSEAYYIGASEADATVPALFRERMLLNTSTSTIYTAAEELVQGVENMQILYGVDDTVVPDGKANRYVKANEAPLTTAANWQHVVTVRLMLRMRSINPVYNENVAYPVFQGIAGTNGSDRFMRQEITTTLQVRN